MDYKAILFGSISTLIETSELQRQFFNEAGLDWYWDQEDYRFLLQNNAKIRHNYF